MAIGHTAKDERQLVWEDNKDYIRTQVQLALRKLRRRLYETSLEAASRDYLEGLEQGELRELGPSVETIQELIAAEASKLVLETGE